MAIPKYTPFVFAAAAIAWWLFCQWLRHRSYKKRIHTRIAPDTQLLGWMGSIGALLLAIAGLVLAGMLKSQ